MCVYLSVPQCVRAGQRSTFRNQFSPSDCMLETEFSELGSVVSILPAQSPDQLQFCFCFFCFLLLFCFVLLELQPHYIAWADLDLAILLPQSPKG